MKALVLTGKDQPLNIQDIPSPAPESGKALVQIQALCPFAMAVRTLDR
ncbi:MAG: hypothetical protein AAGG75_25415 [Bacteroidota bacterium]